jgi:hypothetical protein
VFIYVDQALVYSGAVVPTAGSSTDLLLAYFGQLPVVLSSPFSGTFISTSAGVTLGACLNGAPHVGAFFAPTVLVAPGATVIYQAPSNILIAAPPAGGLGACSVLIRPRDNLSGEQQADQFQADVARYCTSVGESKCIAYLIGRANVDYTDAAYQLISAAFSPAQYLALSRDRRRKLTEAQGDSSFATAVCAGPDSDDDWIPDSLDQCPNTPPLTATFDNGCPTNSLPPAPSAATFQSFWPLVSAMIDPLCGGAPAPEPVSGLSLWFQIGQGAAFVMSSAVTNQPPGCHVWYVFDIRPMTPSGPAAAPFLVAWESAESIAYLGGIPLLPQISSNFVQFVAAPGEGGGRSQLAALTYANVSLSFRVMVVNGNGMRSSWSEWKSPNESDCIEELGVSCAPPHQTTKESTH